MELCLFQNICQIIFSKIKKFRNINRVSLCFYINFRFVTNNNSLKEKDISLVSYAIDVKVKRPETFSSDIAVILNKISNMQVESGIYNISSNKTITIKSLIEDIRNFINPAFILNFGALQYRKNQSMHMEGDILRLCSQIGDVEITDYKIALQNSLNYYLKK